MSRLIDADKLIEKISYQFVHSDGRIDFDEVKYNILTQPTAYKVDKVVEQLEDELRYISLIEGLNYMEFKEAIDVVKAGGIDEN